MQIRRLFLKLHCLACIETIFAFNWLEIFTKLTTTINKKYVSYLNAFYALKIDYLEAENERLQEELLKVNVVDDESRMHYSHNRIEHDALHLVSHDDDVNRSADADDDSQPVRLLILKSDIAVRLVSLPRTSSVCHNGCI